MILPAMGVVSEIVACYARTPRVRLPVHGLRPDGHRRDRLPGVGPPHVHGRHLAVLGPRLLAPVLHRGRALGDQGVQLVGDAVPGPHPARPADALRPGLRRPVHHRRADRTDAGLGADRHPRHRHLLHHRPFPLHHGRRHGVRLLRRPALLVAEDHRPALSRRLGQVRRGDHVPRLQLHLLPPVHHGLPRHAAALPQLSARVSGVARAVVERRRDPGGGLSHAAVLLRLVAGLGQTRGAQSLGRDRAGVDRPLPAAQGEFRAYPGSHGRGLRLPRNRPLRRRPGRRERGRGPPAAARAFRGAHPAARGQRLRHVAVPRHRGAVLRGAVRLLHLHRVPRTRSDWTPGRTRPTPCSARSTPCCC